jgi:glycosyltransferase involved in cell wall biosynthesis
MKILALTSSYPRYDGDPTAPFIESITKHLAARGHAVHVVLPAVHGWAHEREEGNVRFHPYRYSPVESWTPWGFSGSLEAGVKIRRPLYGLAPIVVTAGARAVSSLLARERFDVVQTHWVIPNGPLGAVAARRHDLPHVVSLHGSDVSVPEHSRTLARVARWSFDRADVVTAPSGDLLERARALGAQGSLELVPYGADVDGLTATPEQVRDVREELGVRPGGLVVMGIGRFVRWKGFDYLLDAFARARSRHDELTLVLVGDGDLRDELVARAGSLGIADDVRFTGMVARDRMPAHLGAADIVVVPSIHYDGYVDGLPNVALESLAVGKPLVATRVGGLPELVAPGENGLLVEEKDAASLADAIDALAADADLRTRLGSTGRRQIAESRTWDDVAARFESIFADVRSRNGRGRGPTTSAPRALYFGTFERDYPRNSQVIACLRRVGVEVEERHVPVWDGRRHKYSIGPRATARLAMSELELLRRPKVDFDVLIVGYPGHFDMPAARRIADGRPIVFNPLVSLEDTMVGDRQLVRSRSPLGRALHRIDRYAFRHADLVVADTAAHGRYLVEHFDLPADRVDVCFVGAEDDLFTPGARPDLPFEVLFVGKFIPLHGVDVILEAARLCPEVAFRIVGSGQLDDLLTAATPNVRWEKWIDYHDLPGAYHAAGCALGIFGRTEKAERVIPNKAFQAMATETPLVTADTPAARELLEDGRNALLVPLGDPEGLADAVQRLAANESLRRELAASGRATYLERASEAVLGSRWRELLERLLERRH